MDYTTMIDTLNDRTARKPKPRKGRRRLAWVLIGFALKLAITAAFVVGFDGDDQAVARPARPAFHHL